MKIHFYKYQATGNDFVIIDNRVSRLVFTKSQIEQICDRKFGVGADGLMLIERHPSLNFKLEYFNSDGSQSLCGNGSRAAVHFAATLGIVNGKSTFEAFDGPHDAQLNGEIVSIKMNNVREVKSIGDDFFINTGSPHYIRFVQDLKNYPVFEEGRKIRNSETFKPGGTNVNFLEILPNNVLFVRTYERGVEDETLSCGTGVTAAALAASLKGLTSPISIKALGGDLSIEFKKPKSSGDNGHSVMFEDIFLVGPAKMVFEGHLEL
ncbi:diaminopimelate epimerase [Pseudochryseolinea flava]|uniref:Diaminopimelate epimerase n=1 Tax=Pseudochryseolinea flava TaxID=2059302 RepID=A0A364Y8S7_9BACT|nr:diaminopimelate epimerase [Pseudochryseolinea flava]RAW03387.1 diaminopimelate epimerase [Pseudochryseolinea flava]